MGSSNNIREDIRKESRLARVRPAPTAKIGKSADGKQWVEGSSGTSVVHCPTCSCPVVDSRQGRRGHAQRRPECAAGIMGA
jgi:hypothetical protein